MKENKGLHIYYLATISAILLWSASFIATKLAYETFAPIQLGAVRTFLAVIIFGITRLLTGEKEKINKEDRIQVAFSGFLGLTLYFTIENLGVSMTTASNAALLVASFPAVTILFEFFLYHSKPTIKKVSGIIMALIGVGILTQITVEGSYTSFLGNVILLSAGIVWAFYNFTTRRLSGKYKAMTLTYYQMLAGTILFTPFVFVEGGEWKLPSFTSLGSLVYLSVGCSVMAFLLYNLGLRKLSASASVSLMNLVPIFGLVFSITILGEEVSAIQIFGGVIVIVGVALSSIEKRELDGKVLL
ncbi:MAG TPA: DMT family transporter [Anaerovoracaceae bacterium]|nr:DMT family transporter [Anaerovoracaceae bacterium]